MPVHMWWLNAGVAPVYREYQLAVELRSANGSGAANVPVDVRKWLPGDAVFDGPLYVPENLKPGQIYRAHRNAGSAHRKARDTRWQLKGGSQTAGMSWAK